MLVCLPAGLGVGSPSFAGPIVVRIDGLQQLQTYDSGEDITIQVGHVSGVRLVQIFDSTPGAGGLPDDDIGHVTIEGSADVESGVELRVLIAGAGLAGFPFSEFDAVPPACNSFRGRNPDGTPRSAGITIRNPSSREVAYADAVRPPVVVQQPRRDHRRHRGRQGRRPSVRSSSAPASSIPRTPPLASRPTSAPDAQNCNIVAARILAPVTVGNQLKGAVIAYGRPTVSDPLPPGCQGCVGCPPTGDPLTPGSPACNWTDVGSAFHIYGPGVSGSDGQPWPYPRAIGLKLNNGYYAAPGIYMVNPVAADSVRCKHVDGEPAAVWPGVCANDQAIPQSVWGAMGYGFVISGDCDEDDVMDQFDCALTGPGCSTNCDVADFNNSGQVTVQDIFDFLTAYFGNCSGGEDPPCYGANADVNNSGAVTVQDIFDFLAAYFGATNC